MVQTLAQTSRTKRQLSLFHRLSLCGLLPKTLRINKIAVKSFSQINRRIKINAPNMGDVNSLLQVVNLAKELQGLIKSSTRRLLTILKFLKFL